MDTNNLQIFVEVMRRGSFAAVARELDVVPSTISRAVASLESELGVRLLQRTTRQLKPTEAGQAYFQRVEPLIEELEQARSVTVDLGKGPVGKLRLTASMTFGNTAIVPLLSEFMDRYPGLSLHLDLSDAVVDIVDQGIDLAIRLGQVIDTELVVTKLADMQFVATASPAYLARYGTPQTPQDLQHHQCLVLPVAGMRSEWLFRDRQGRVTAIQPNSRLQMTNALALKQCALADMGITLSSKWTVWQELKAGKLVELLTDYEPTIIDFDNAIWLVYPSRHYLPLKVRVFIDFIKEKFRQGNPWDPHSS